MNAGNRINRSSRPTITFVACAIALLACVGCRTLNTRHIIGQQVADDVCDLFHGAWKVEDTIIQIRQTAPGELRAAILEWDDEEDRFAVNEMSFILSRLDDEFYIHSTSDVAPEGETWWQFSRLRADGNTIVVWGVNWNAFSEAVRTGELAGRIDDEQTEGGQRVPGRNIWLDAEKEALDDFIRGNPFSEIFEAHSPTVLVRLTKE